MRAIVRPEGVALDQWLQSFPSFGFLLAVAPSDVRSVLELFRARKIAAAEIGGFNETRRVTIADGCAERTIWNFAQGPLLGCATREGVAT
jgi:uncharacterized protein